MNNPCECPYCRAVLTGTIEDKEWINGEIHIFGSKCPACGRLLPKIKNSKKLTVEEANQELDKIPDLAYCYMRIPRPGEISLDGGFYLSELKKIVEILEKVEEDVE